MGRLSVEKDHAKLICAFARLRLIHSGAKLIILGDGPLKQKLMHLVKDLGQEDYIHLLGRRSNPFPFVKKANCFVLSSNHEGQPMVLFEAMILEKPIISTDIVGSRSAIEGRSGHLVENSEEGLLQGMKDFIEGNLTLKTYDITEYQKEAIGMFYKKVCGE
jgi:CDP-glycerol glycerophosphotransferase